MKWIRRRSIIAAASVGAVMVLAVSGCSSSRTVANEGSSTCDTSAFTKANIDWKQQSGTTINIAVEEHPWWQTIKPQIACFEELTGIKVKASVLGEDQYVSKVATQLSSGSTTPDVFMVNQFGQAQGSGWLQPLDSYLGDSKLTDKSWYNVDDFFKGARDFAQADGKYWAMPITAEAQMLFVRDDLVKTAPKTIDDLVKAAEAAKTDSVGGFGSRAVANANETPWPFAGFAFSDGGSYLDETGKPHLDSEANVQALKEYAELINSAGLPGASGWGFLENEQAMQQGKLAIWTDSSTFLGALKDATQSKNAKDISAYPFPTGASGKSLPNAWYWTVGINSKSQQKDAAWLFLQWATSESISEEGALNGASPARQAAWDSADASKSIGEDNAARVKAAIASVDSSYMANAWKTTTWNQVADPLARAINSGVTGSDPAAALKGAQQAAEAVTK
jgi:multiple sugar transport system substrate-binding protein